MVKLLPEILLHSAEAHRLRPAVQDPDAKATYEQLAVQAMQIATSLRALGQRRGDRSVVALPNGVPFVAAHFGNLFAGAVSVPFDAAVAPESFKFMAANCRPRFLLTNSAGATRLLGAARESGVEKIICLDEPSAELRAAGALGPADFFSADEPKVFLDGISPGDLAVLMYTTGTTGQAKGVQLTHDNVLHALRHICEFVGYTADDREVVILPLSHNSPHSLGRLAQR